jgi:hypothetical protein
VLAIIGARARKQRRLPLELTASGADAVLTLSANGLAIIAACLPTDGHAHIARQWRNHPDSQRNAGHAEPLVELARRRPAD